LKNTISELEQKLTFLSESEEKVDVLNRLSAYIRSSNINRALEMSITAKEISCKLNYKAGMALSYWNAGICYRLLSKYDLAFKHFDSSYQIFEVENDVQGMAKVLNSIGNIYANLRNYPSAFQYLKQSLQLLEKLEEPDLEASVLSNIGVLYQEIGDYSSALEYYHKSIQTYTDYNLSIPETLLNNIGAVYENLEDYNTALEYYFRSLKLAEEKQNKLDKGFALVNIALVYGDLKKYDEALQYLSESLQILQQIGYKKGEVNSLSHISTSYTGMKELDKALEFQFKVLKLREEINDISGQAETLSDIGEIYFNSGKFMASKKYFSDSLNIARKTANKIIEARNLILIGKLHFKLDEFDEALNCLNKGLKLSEERNAKKDIMEIHKAFYEGYKRMGKIEKALCHHELFYEAENEINNLESDKKLKALTAQHRIESAENEKRIALKDNEIYRLRNVELADLNEKLKHVNEEKNDFLGITAHDLKNPLSGIISFSKRMQTHAEKLKPEEVMNYSREIEKASEKMFDIVTKILDISAIESGRRNIQKEQFDPSVLAQRVVLDYRQKAEAKNIEIIFENNANLKICTDKTALRQILDNLISNAIKFSPFDKKIFLRVGSNGKLRFEIEDEGPGLTEKDKTKLFGKFTRLSAQPTGGENSTGLGLSITKKLIEILDGTISCISEQGKGAKFIVELPISRD
jgi:signal transduction histidine kinase